MTNRLYIILLITLFFLRFATAQNVIVNSLEGDNIDDILTQHLAGQGVTISNGKFNNISGNVAFPQIGFFDANNSSFPIASGLVMTTGDVSIVPGPNEEDGLGYEVYNFYTDPLLESIASESVYGCSTIDFDFVSVADTFAFSYVFASEEYPEYVCSEFNDVFAFFLSGPDPATAGATSFTNKNIAVIPGSITPQNPDGYYVAINTINNGVGLSGSIETDGCIDAQYSYLYVSNPSDNEGVEYDGYTIVLTAGAKIIAGATYHMHLSVGNVGDNAFDSGVFLKANSFWNPTSYTFDTAFCENDFPVTIENIVFESPGSQALVLTNASGADSTVTINVNSIPLSYNTMDVTVLETDLPYILNDESYYLEGTYSQMFTNQYGCDSILTLILNIECIDILKEENMSICSNQTPLSWNGLKIYESGNYSVSYTKNNGCDSTINLNLEVIPISAAIVSGLESLCTDGYENLQVITNNSDFIWNTGEQYQSIIAYQSGKYSVTVTEGNCTATTDYLIEKCDPIIYLPNTITPSGSNETNCCFKLPDFTKKDIEYCEIIILNRWGNKVFASNDKNFVWDGKVDNKVFPNTIYNYILYFTDTSGQKYRKMGSILVL